MCYKQLLLCEKQGFGASLYCTKWKRIDYLLNKGLFSLQVLILNFLLMKPLSQSPSACIVPLPQRPAPAHRLCLPTFSGQAYITPKQLLYLKADGNYCDIWVQSPGGSVQCYHLSVPLKAVSEQLDETFVYIHRSVVVRLTAIQSYRNGRGGQLELIDGSWHNLAARRKKKVLQRLAQSCRVIN